MCDLCAWTDRRREADKLLERIGSFWLEGHERTPTVSAQLDDLGRRIFDTRASIEKIMHCSRDDWEALQLEAEALEALIQNREPITDIDELLRARGGEDKMPPKKKAEKAGKTPEGDTYDKSTGEVLDEAKPRTDLDDAVERIMASIGKLSNDLLHQAIDNVKAHGQDASFAITVKLAPKGVEVEVEASGKLTTSTGKTSGRLSLDQEQTRLDVDETGTGMVIEVKALPAGAAEASAPAGA